MDVAARSNSPSSRETPLQCGRHAHRVAALYDIHGNIVAVDAVLTEISRLDVDLVLVGGDIVWGPHPRETLERLLALEDRAVFIRGNADREVAHPPAAPLDREPNKADEITRFCADRLDPDQLEWLVNLPLTASIEVETLGAVLFCHASPRNDEEILLPTTTDERIRTATGGMEGIVVCGHTHIQFDHGIGDVRLINAGSVGMPYEDLPGAYWTLFDSVVTPKRTSYSFEGAVESMRRSGCPHVEEAFVDTILNPPGRDDALAHFTLRAEAAT